jgi:hypothetical protein
MMLNRAYFDEELLKQIFLPRKVFNCILFSHAFHELCTVFNKWIRGNFHSDGLLRNSPCDFSLVIYLIEHRIFSKQE